MTLVTSSPLTAAFVFASSSRLLFHASGVTSA